MPHEHTNPCIYAYSYDFSLICASSRTSSLFPTSNTSYNIWRVCCHREQANQQKTKWEYKIFIIQKSRYNFNHIKVSFYTLEFYSKPVLIFCATPKIFSSYFSTFNVHWFYEYLVEVLYKKMLLNCGFIRRMEIRALTVELMFQAGRK